LSMVGLSSASSSAFKIQLYYTCESSISLNMYAQELT
jgi:hypothetical protein